MCHVCVQKMSTNAASNAMPFRITPMPPISEPSPAHGFDNVAQRLSTARVRFVSKYSHRFAPSKPGDVGHDLFVVIHDEDLNIFDRILNWWLGLRSVSVKSMIIWPKQTRMLRCGIFLSMPDSVWVEIKERSSTLRKKMKVLGGTIDSGYRGQLFAPLYNFGFIPRVISNSERYAQAIFLRAERPELIRVDYFKDADMSMRGDTGFGSTGA